jgi:CxxC motif-containing protein (DUF1111 family)
MDIIRWKYLAVLVFAAASCLAQSDRGPRGGAPGAGAAVAGLTAGESDFFNIQAIPQFSQVEDVADGLGPRFNLDSCGGCHIHPALGGSSPSTNPQFTNASIMAPGNTVPSFITQTGPIREVRFIKNADGSPDGGVHGIFTIAGRADKPAGCTIQQPDFATQQSHNNVIFRIPTPVFGAGLIEAISDRTIKSNLASDPGGLKANFGIKGRLNTNGNDGTVTRFGWKAQNKSLLIFSGEAYNVEMGVTSENFQNERDEDPNCATNGTPENRSGFNVGSTDPADIVAFMGFMKFLDQPTPVSSFGTVTAASISNGRNLFTSTGCATCHTATLITGSSTTAALSNKQVNLFSDLAVHHMGSNLADGVTQGAAGPDEFRTAPLWGAGQRLFFLHDGRTSDLLQTIEAHATNCGLLGGLLAGCVTSEANTVVDRFHSLSSSQKQDVLNFLRSL